MNHHRITTGRSIRRSRLRRGMTFIEVLFAVIILGVGFIMVAAVFPVAIQQTQSNIDETTAAALARGAVNTLMSVNMRSYLPLSAPTGYAISPAQALSLHDGDSATPPWTATNTPLKMWYAVRGSVISTADPRYAWAAYYVWPQNASSARVVVVVARCRNRTLYDQFHDTNRWASGVIGDQNSSTPATLEGQNIPIAISSYPDPLIPSQLIYYLPDANPSATNDPIATLAYLVVQNDATNNGYTNGYMFRVGNYDAAHSGWDLLPGNDLTGLLYQGTAINSIAGTAYIVGRGYLDPMNPQNGFDGPAQEVGAYTTFIPMY